AWGRSARVHSADSAAPEPPGILGRHPAGNQLAVSIVEMLLDLLVEVVTGLRLPGHEWIALSVRTQRLDRIDTRRAPAGHVARDEGNRPEQRRDRRERRRIVRRDTNQQALH